MEKAFRLFFASVLVCLLAAVTCAPHRPVVFRGAVRAGAVAGF